jgi:hypothetical protein
LLRIKPFLVTLSLLIAVAVEYYANTKGWWLATFIAGLCLALLPIRPRAAVLISVAASALGWFLPLVWLSMTYNLHDAAAVIASVMGFGIKLWWMADLFTVLTGVLLGLAGTWLGTAVLALAFPARYESTRPGKTATAGASRAPEA